MPHPPPGGTIIGLRLPIARVERARWHRCWRGIFQSFIARTWRDNAASKQACPSPSRRGAGAFGPPAAVTSKASRSGFAARVPLTPTFRRPSLRNKKPRPSSRGAANLEQQALSAGLADRAAARSSAGSAITARQRFPADRRCPACSGNPACAARRCRRGHLDRQHLGQDLGQDLRQCILQHDLRRLQSP